MEPAFNYLQIVGAIFAALLGLAFGSFLNVVISRLPQGESIATPRSHCRNCDHTLAWWENIPLLSWLILKGRCHQCQAGISARYPLIELAIATLWTIWAVYEFKDAHTISRIFSNPSLITPALIVFAAHAIFFWLLVALAVLDAQHFWLPDRLTIPGIIIGLAFSMFMEWFYRLYHEIPLLSYLPRQVVERLMEILASAAIILVIRLAYWLIRRQEGIGLGDAKLMAMLGAWLGLRGALESFALAIFGALIAALVWLAILAVRRKSSEWAKMSLPLGTFLCLGALTEIFYPNWLWTTWTHTFFNY